MKTIIAFLVCLVYAGCSSGVKTTRSSSVRVDRAPECVKQSGETVTVIDTSCADETALCYKINPFAKEYLTAGDEFGLSAASIAGIRWNELLCFTRMDAEQGASQNLWTAGLAAGGIRQLTYNSGGVHQGSPSFSPDGQWMYFAAKNRPDAAGESDLYVASVKQGTDGIMLENVRNLSELNSKYFDSHPSVSPDGTVLYFASDRPGGQGNTDIWYTRRSGDGTWNEAQNPGSAINTTCNEMTPFIAGDNKTLFFASDGYNSLGGFDLFSTEQLGAAEWSPPENLGAPLNSVSDELFPSMPPSVRSDSVLWFSSNRDGGQGGYDLYVISPNPRPPAMITIRGTVKSEHSKQAIPDARLFWKDKTSGTLIATVETNSNGDFFVVLTKGHEYEVGALAENHFYDTYSLQTPDAPGIREFSHDFYLTKTLDLRINFPFNDWSHPLSELLDEEGQPSSTTWEEAMEYLALNLSSYSDRIEKVLIGGHTDSVGSVEYNLELSGKRAAFVRDFLVEKYDFDASLIDVESHGESRPLTQRPGESEELFQTRCRRVQVKQILKSEGREQK